MEDKDKTGDELIKELENLRRQSVRTGTVGSQTQGDRNNF